MDGWAHRQKEGLVIGPPSAQIERHTDRQTSIWTDRQMEKNADTQKKQTDRHAEGWTDKSLMINGYCH
jgi:hypothetical protein